MAVDMDLQDWIGRSQEAGDVLRAQPAQFMQATLDREPSLKDGDLLPPLWHWLYFLEAKRASELGRDAHPKKGGFLPPVSLPRRMWAGGRLTFHHPLILGQAAVKRSTIKSITEKSGRSGSLCFVTVAHEIIQNDQCALTEEQDIVYRRSSAGCANATTCASARQSRILSSYHPNRSDAVSLFCADLQWSPHPL